MPAGENPESTSERDVSHGCVGDVGVTAGLLCTVCFVCDTLEIGNSV